MQGKMQELTYVKDLLLEVGGDEVSMLRRMLTRRSCCFDLRVGESGRGGEDGGSILP